MTDSEDSTLHILTSDSETASVKNKNELKIMKHKIKRSGDSLILNPTPEELDYRKNFSCLDVVKDFPRLIRCTRCQMSFKKAILDRKQIYSHPLLQVLFCNSCCEYYGDGNFSLDEDGEDKYCRWCGEGGSIFLCSKCVCGFCPKCIKKHFGVGKVKEIENDDDWICYFCNPEPLWKLRTVCHLAIEQAQLKNGTVLESEISETSAKRKAVGKNPSEEEKSVLTASDQIDGFDSPDFGSTGGERSRTSRRKRKRTASPKVKVNTSQRASSIDSVDNGCTRVSKRRRISRWKQPVGKNDGVGKQSKSKRSSLNNSQSNHQQSSSSDPEDSSSVEDRSDKESPKSNSSSRKQTPKDSPKELKDRHLEKLKDILKVAEITSELCLDMCRKKSKKLSRKGSMSEVKLVSECEKLKSMIILMSSSLSTVHNLIISLQQKFGTKISVDSAFQVEDDSSLLKVMGKILREKRVKTSHIIEIVNDIINRYLYIETGPKMISDIIKVPSKLIHNITRRSARGSSECCCNESFGLEDDRSINVMRENLNSDSDSVTDKVEGCTRNSPGKNVTSNNDGNDDSRSSKERTPGEMSLGERTICDSDTSTQIFEYDLNNRSGLSGHDQGSNNGDTDARNISRDGEVVIESSVNEAELDNRQLDYDGDLQKVYAESMALKQQLLKSSSDDSVGIVDDSHSSDSTIDDSSKKIKENKKLNLCLRQRDKEFSGKSKEDRDLKRLMDLKSLEGEARRNKSDEGNSSIDEEEEKRLCTTNKRILQTETGASDDSCNSHSDTHSADSNFFQNHSSGIELVKENALMLKKFILETTSTSSDSHSENSLSKKKSEKKESVDGRIVKKRVLRKNRKTSPWRFRRLLRESSSSDLSTDELESRWRAKMTKEKGRKPSGDDDSGDDGEGDGKSKDDSNDGGDVSDDSLKSKRLLKKRGLNKVVVSTDNEVSDSTSEVKSVKQSNVESPIKGRKNIKKILKKENLQLETKQAVKIENERKKRICERNEIYKKLYPNMANSDRLVLDFNQDTKEVLLEVPRKLAKALKPHQKEGVKFMWDCCFESVESLEENNGSGCVLAHCMGLGKTLQIIALIYTVMKNNLGVNTVLILCPLNVINNWLDEFELWLKDLDFEIDVYKLSNHKQHYHKYYEIKQWHENGGVLVLSYDTMRNLTNTLRMARYKMKNPKSFYEFLLDPGPDLVVCDEGHLLKNEDTALSKSIRRIKTSRRIILTGTPLQNNLLEYHSMIQFIKPNILGSRKEFMNRFVNPIINGQFEDSTESDVKLMRARSHVLHKLLDGCIQRYNYSVLTPFLPEKHEYVISIRLTDTQAKLYQYYIDKCRKISLVPSKGTKLFSDFHWLQKIWTHPKALLDFKNKCEDMKNTNDGKRDEDSNASDDSVMYINPDGTNPNSTEVMYWEEVVRPEEYEDINSSGKLVVLFHILKQCRKVGNKVLVFSQSLSTLNLIEHFLHRIDTTNNSKTEDNLLEYKDTWVEGIDYFRMDGSTSMEIRSKWCKLFNNENNKRSRLFLISTRAGGLGINLIGANRVVLFDVSWNPSYDVQSIFRVYRFGQSKPCYVYRFFAEGTMEEKIYARQVTKVSLEKRVLDEHQIERHYTMGNLQELYKYDPMPKEKWTIPKLPKDMLLAEILKIHKDTIVTYHEHDSLLENKEEEELTEEERKAAWEDFEKEKFMMENELKRRRDMAVMWDFQNMDAVTQEVLRITEFGKRAGMEIPYFTPSFGNFPNSDPPFRVVNVGSIDRQLPGPSTRPGFYGPR